MLVSFRNFNPVVNPKAARITDFYEGYVFNDGN